MDWGRGHTFETGGPLSIIRVRFFVSRTLSTRNALGCISLVRFNIRVETSSLLIVLLLDHHAQILHDGLLV